MSGSEGTAYKRQNHYRLTGTLLTLAQLLAGALVAQNLTPTSFDRITKEWDLLIDGFAEQNDAVTKELDLKCPVEPFASEECMELSVIQARLQGVLFEVNEKMACALAQVGSWDAADRLFNISRINENNSDAVYILAGREGVLDDLQGVSSQIDYFDIEKQGYEFVRRWPRLCGSVVFDTLFERWSRRKSRQSR